MQQNSLQQERAKAQAILQQCNCKVTQKSTRPISSGPEQAERMDEQGEKVVRLVADRRGTALM